MARFIIESNDEGQIDYIKNTLDMRNIVYDYQSEDGEDFIFQVEVDEEKNVE